MFHSSMTLTSFYLNVRTLTTIFPNRTVGNLSIVVPVDSGKMLEYRVGLVLISIHVMNKMTQTKMNLTINRFEMTSLECNLTQIWRKMFWVDWIYLVPCIVNVSDQFVMLGQIRHCWSFWQPSLHWILISENIFIDNH